MHIPRDVFFFFFFFLKTFICVNLKNESRIHLGWHEGKRVVQLRVQYFLLIIQNSKGHHFCFRFMSGKKEKEEEQNEEGKQEKKKWTKHACCQVLSI